MTPEQRTALYAVVPALVAVLTVYGYVTEEQAASIVAAALAILACAVAFINRPTKDA